MVTNKELAAALAAANEETLTALANKGIYKRACKDTEGVQPVYEEKDGSAEVTLGGETVRVCVPLGESKCSCPSRTVCRHIIGAVLLLKGEVPDDVQAAEEPKAPEAVKEVKEEKSAKKNSSEQSSAEEVFLSEREAAKVRECAVMCMELLGRLSEQGLVRIPETLPENLELAAVRCHANKMAQAERLMRELGGRSSECAERRASFSPTQFMRRLCECVKLMNALGADKISESALGEFRKTYTELNEPLNILPIGMRRTVGGEYEGDVYYFLDLNRNSKHPFLSISDIRPVFYESSSKRRRPPSFTPWGLAVPLRTMMKSKMTLVRAKISGGKLSSSQDTDVISHTKASLNCPEVHRRLIDDFRIIAAELNKRSDDELDRLFFVLPEKCVECGFDKYTQTYVMTLEDSGGRRISAKAKYKSETKELIAQLEDIGEKMRSSPEKCFTLLAVAYIENGELTLFPIEMYDFIVPLETSRETLDEKYEHAAKKSAYAEPILSLFEDIENVLASIVQFGLCSDISSGEGLKKRCTQLGMKGLTERLSALLESASAYRHRSERSTDGILQGMTEVLDYIDLGRKKLGTFSALGKMERD